MTREAYSGLLNIIYIILESNDRYTIEISHYEKIIIKISNDKTNKVIYNRMFNEDAETYFDLSNRLRRIFITYNALYSKLDNLNRANKTYYKQTIYAQNLSLVINMTKFNESMTAIKYHKEINYPKQTINLYEKLKTTKPRTLVR